MTDRPTPRPPKTAMTPSPHLSTVPPAAATPDPPTPDTARQGPRPITSVTLTVTRGDAVILRSIRDLTQTELDAAATHVTATLGPDIPVLVLNGRDWGIHVIRGAGTR